MQKEHHWSGKRNTKTHMIMLGNGVGARVEAAALQGSHRRGTETTTAAETDPMAMMLAGTRCVIKARAVGVMTTMTEAETGRRTEEREGDHT